MVLIYQQQSLQKQTHEFAKIDGERGGRGRRLGISSDLIVLADVDEILFLDACVLKYRLFLQAIGFQAALALLLDDSRPLLRLPLLQREGRGKDRAKVNRKIEIKMKEGR